MFYPFVVPADVSQQAKSAAADGLTYSDLNILHFWSPRKNEQILTPLYTVLILLVNQRD
jgi:hypothetical protein